MSTSIWLASGSPRRRDLLTWAGFAVDVHPTHAPEHRRPGVPPVEHARELARRKADAAVAPTHRVVVAADTVVHRADRIFEKPTDRDHAIEMLQTLSGSDHSVTTGVCLRLEGNVHTLHHTTQVRFRALTLREITAYVQTGESDDKAGAYGIQGRAGSFVAGLQGDYTNVVGLPLEATLIALAKLGVTP